MKLLGIDFETNNLDVSLSDITEVGAMLVESLSSPPLVTIGAFCYLPTYPPQSDDLVELTGITDQMLKEFGRNPVNVLEKELFPAMEEADYIVAYNKSYDEEVLKAVSARLGLTPPKKHWICAMNDVQYPRKFRCKQLAHLAFDHGIDVDREMLHRAVGDVELMFKLLAKYDIKEIISLSLEPYVYLVADVPKPWEDNGIGKEKVKRLKYQWEQCYNDKQKFEKSWVKKVKQSQVAEELSQLKAMAMTAKVVSL